MPIKPVALLGQSNQIAGSCRLSTDNEKAAAFLRRSQRRLIPATDFEAEWGSMHDQGVSLGRGLKAVSALSEFHLPPSRRVETDDDAESSSKTTNCMYELNRNRH